MFNMIEEIFAPGRKHIAEEQKRLELTRVDVDGADPGRGPIDLASGKVTIRLGPASEPVDESAPGDAAGTDGTAPAGSAEVPAQAREETPPAEAGPAA